jgi:hypothetical protein
MESFMLLALGQDLQQSMALEKKTEPDLEKIICTYGKHI